MKKLCFLVYILVLCFVLCSCNQTENTEAGNTSATTASSPTPSKTQTFPFEDTEGRMRYRLMINGEETTTENYPFTTADNQKNSYYPLKDVLLQLGVECLCSEDAKQLTTKINGNVLKITANVATMSYGNNSVAALDTNIIPLVVNGVLYVPGFFLMQLSDNSIVDFSQDNSAATFNTDIAIDVASSGAEGLHIDSTESGSSGSNTSPTPSGKQVCTKCGGAGGYNNQYFEQVLVNGQWQQIPKTRWEACPECAGSGYK